MAILPFIKYIVGEVSVEINIYVIYFMFLINTVCSYLFSYKKNYLYANQKNYIIGFFNIAFKILVNIIQISLLIIKRNYYIYLAINIILQIAENLLITIYVNKKYPILIEKNVKKLDKNTEKDIFKKVKALILHKIGTIVINGTDNIIISTFLGVVTVGYYSNYYTIISAVKVIFVQLITSITASVGNLICTENKTKCFEVFKRIRFLTFWLATFSSVSILVIMEPFIKIWVGEQFVLPVIVLVSLVFNYFQSVMRTSYSVFKDAAGIWYEDRFVPLIESITNIIFSIILLKIFGLAGVFMGTCVSGLVLWCYSYPKFVYKKIFERQYYSYIKESLGYVFLFTIISIFTYYISNLLVAPNNYLQVIINSIICILIPNGILIIIFRKTENFKYFVSIIKNLVNNFKINNEKI
jgi:O-antigen/teichoic acid export membrane protein